MNRKFIPLWSKPVPGDQMVKDGNITLNLPFGSKWQDRPIYAGTLTHRGIIFR